MSAADDRPPKLLFVLSKDHGELFNAMYFLLESDLRGTLAMPPKMFATNDRDQPYPAYEYRTAEDVLEIVDRIQPDVVLLFSGYLYVINRLFDLPSFERLLRGLRDRHLTVATTDPSVGVMSKSDDHNLDPESPGREWLRQLSPRIAHLLRDMTHIYLAPDVQTAALHRSFFNPRIVPDEAGMTRIRASLKSWQPIDPERRRWFFVLSPEDYAIQLSTWGAEAFTDALVHRLQDTANADIQPILVAPGNCIARIRETGIRIPRLVALASCNYTLFMRLLLEAEHVFYWNTFSASIVARVLCHLPVFFFDRGHLAKTLRPFWEVGMRHFYRDCTLSELDLRLPLEAHDLAERAARQEGELFDPVWRNFRRSPLPEAVVASLI